MSIKLLPPSLQNQIAAGEVVERPASIVKELVENSIDAGANEVSIEIEQGGVKKIKIQDNGHGMSKEDAIMSFTRYATSKISAVDDLFTLSSFGFRGEALASIASIANVRLKTKRKEDDIAIEVSQTGEVSQCPLPDGTEIIIENVFGNVPARRKFLKSDTTETREITKVVENFALSHPEVSFTFTNNGKEVFSYLKNTGEHALKNRAQEVLGKSIAQHFIPLQHQGTDIHISGYATHPNFHRSAKDKQYIFVNNRMIQSCSTVSAAVSQAYHTLMPKGKFPAFIIHIQLRSDLVDVNVHPRKTEVKFIHQSDIFSAVKGSLSHALSSISGQNIAPQSQAIGNFSSPSSFSNRAFVSTTQSNAQQHSPHTHTHKNCTHSFPKPIYSAAIPLSTANDTMEDLSSHESEKDWSIVGQVRNSFIILEEKNGMRVVDQHAAHERVRLEKLQEEKANKQVQTQNLLSPHIFSVSQSDKQILLSESKNLQSAGFEIEDFGGSEVSISAVPAGSEHVDIEKMFTDILSDCDSFDSEYTKHVHSFADRAMSYTACRGAKKFGDTLSPLEMQALITDWKGCKHPESCAHGRPVSVLYPYKELENECGRY